MFTENEINNACEHLKVVLTVSDDLIEFMRDASIEKLHKDMVEAQDAQIDADAKMLEKKFSVKVMQEMAQLCFGTGVGIDMLADFVKYRNEIKKPIRTARPLKAFAQELIKISDAGYDIKQAIVMMQNREWQTINADWVAKGLPKQTGADLTQFGFAPQNAQRLIK